MTKNPKPQKRKPIAKDIELKVLTLSRRRCCLCYGIRYDYREKQGQIAHLDHNPGNNDLSNLAWLCFEHHDTYDSKTSQSKGITIEEVKFYREQLHIVNTFTEEKVLSAYLEALTTYPLDISSSNILVTGKVRKVIGVANFEKAMSMLITMVLKELLQPETDISIIEVRGDSIIEEQVRHRFDLLILYPIIQNRHPSEITTMVKQVTPNTRVLCLSPEPSPEFTVLLYEGRVDHVMTMPYQIDVFVAIVRKELGIIDLFQNQ